MKIGQFRTVLKKLLQLNNLDSSYYSCTTIRAGRATDLAEHLSIESVRKLGRWRSSAIYTYLRT